MKKVVKMVPSGSPARLPVSGLDQHIQLGNTESDTSHFETDGGVNAKLSYLIQKLDFGIEGESSTDKSLPSAETIVSTLRSKYREYRRKDISKLTLSVEAVLRHLSSTATSGSGIVAPTALAKVADKTIHNRKSIDDDNDDAYEIAALEEEEARKEFEENFGVGGGLNASLRNRYKKMQHKKEILQQIATKINVDDNNVEKEESNTDNATETALVTGNKRAIDDGNVSNSKDTTTSQEVSKIDTTKQPTSSTIKRRKVQRRRISSENVFRGGSGGGEFGVDDSSSSPFLFPVPRPVERYSDLGGVDKIVKEIRQLVEYPLVRPELYHHLGVDPPRGVLLRGPPGTGKTHLANAVAGQLGVPFFRVSAPELVAGMSGESESRIRDLFQAASSCAPSLIFMDELDVIAAKRGGDGGGRGMEKRMVAQLLTSMDWVSPANNRNNCAVVIIAATNRPDAMDPALRRAGRFDREILLGVPDEEARERMIGTMTSKMRLYGDFDCKVLARKTPGYVGADIKSLAKEAAVVAINRIFRDVLYDDNKNIQSKDVVPNDCVEVTMIDGPDTSAELSSNNTTEEPSIPSQVLSIGEVTPLTSQQMEPLYVTMDDFLSAIPLVQPSAKREGFAIIPDVTWNDVGALHSIRQDLKMSVLEPIRNPERFKQLGLPLPAGVMLYGPPGCGKTLLAKAIANESGANFISVKGPELLDKYVGESERSVRLVFERARSSSPCIIFFDELDSLVPRRGSGGDGGGGVSERVVNQLLTEMDGLESRRSVFVIAATNRPELIDPAMMRPGRLDKLLYVPLPTPEERVHIIHALAKKVRLHSDVNLDSIALNSRANGYSGADCAALLREAGLAVLKEMMDKPISSEVESTTILCIASRHFDVAFTTVMPSVSKADQARYDRIRDTMARARSRSNEKVDKTTADDQNETTK